MFSREIVRNLAAEHARKIAVWFEVLPKYVVPLKCQVFADDYIEVLERVFQEEKRRMKRIEQENVGFRIDDS